jgi:hypothetical protein
MRERKRGKYKEATEQKHFPSTVRNREGNREKHREI